MNKTAIKCEYNKAFCANYQQGFLGVETLTSGLLGINVVDMGLMPSACTRTFHSLKDNKNLTFNCDAEQQNSLCLFIFETI